MAEERRSRIARPRTLLVAIIVLAVTITVAHSIWDIQFASEKLAGEADATYGKGNWTWEAVECRMACAYAPQPVNESVPNSSVVLGEDTDG